MNDTIGWFAMAGFLAQLVDGCLGMTYGVISSTLLISLGVPPAAASASIHAAEIFTTGASGFFHFKLGNVDKRLLARLILPGILGGVAGAAIVSSLPARIAGPLVSVYLAVLGAVILSKSFRRKPVGSAGEKHLSALALVGGFLDAVGGGGWGPIVTSTMVARGHHPRFTIGTVNLAEFFVTLSQVFAFSLTIGFTNWRIIAGLIIGGVLAAPQSALLCRKISPTALMRMVGLLIGCISGRMIWKTLIALCLM